MEYNSDVICPRCQVRLRIGNFPFCKGNPADHGATFSKTSMFPFSVNHVDGKPMVIESLHHLRKVEREAGVVFSAFSKDNVRDVAPVAKDLPRDRTSDPDWVRNHRNRY